MKFKYPQQIAAGAHNDEIDLSELVQAIWKRRSLLIVFCLAGLLISIAYALTAKEQWTSVAFVNKPKLKEIGDYLDQRRAMARVTGGTPVDINTLGNELFSSFIMQAAAMNSRLEFLSGTAYYKKQNQKNDAASARKALAKMADKLIIKNYDERQIAPYYELSFSADSAETAQQTLSDYLHWVNNISFRLVDESFNNNLDAQILSRQTEQEKIEFQLESQRQNKIEVLENAVHTARLANITDYVVARQADGATIIELSDSRRLYMLGEKYLTAELETAQTTPIIYPPRYYEIQRELQQLQPLRTYETQTRSYSYQLAPTLPVTRDKPQRTLIVMLGTVLGGMLGLFWILAVNAIGNNRPPLKTTSPSPDRIELT